MILIWFLEFHVIVLFPLTIRPSVVSRTFHFGVGRGPVDGVFAAAGNGFGRSRVAVAFLVADTVGERPTQAVGQVKVRGVVGATTLTTAGRGDGRAGQAGGSTVIHS